MSIPPQFWLHEKRVDLKVCQPAFHEGSAHAHKASCITMCGASTAKSYNAPFRQGFPRCHLGRSALKPVPNNARLRLLVATLKCPSSLASRQGPRVRAGPTFAAISTPLAGNLLLYARITVASPHKGKESCGAHNDAAYQYRR